MVNHLDNEELNFRPDYVDVFDGAANLKECFEYPVRLTKTEKHDCSKTIKYGSVKGSFLEDVKSNKRAMIEWIAS